MSLTVKHLNSDASFLLTFSSNTIEAPATPTSPNPPFSSPSSPSSPSRNDFTVLLDPWLSGASKIWMKSFSQSTHNVPACIETLAALPAPDLVVISQNKTDHCHEATLKQLPASGTKTLILAEPGAARTIRSWKYFEPGKVITLPRWEDTRGKADLTYRIPIPPLSATGQAGEVTVAYIPQKYDINGLHSAVGITYRPSTDPSLHQPSFLANLPLTPPASPIPSFSSMVTSSPKSPKSPPSRALSVLFSPHGINARSIAPYSTTHLAAESALPLTALLHCFDRVQNPWWFGGNICTGADSGKDIARMLNAKAWTSAHDGDKLTTGWATTLLKITKADKEEIEEAVSPRRDGFGGVDGTQEGTMVRVLDVGEEWDL